MKNKSKKLEKHSEKLFTTIDYIGICILTLICGFLIFFNLGSHHVPESSMILRSDGNHEIFLDFGEYINLSTFEIFLGNKNDRAASLFVFNESTGEWITISDDQSLSTVFNWNKLNVYYTGRYFDIVFPDDETVINEIICTSDDTIITPVNTSDYPYAFDEQSLYPQYNSFYYGTMFDEIYHGRTAFEFLNGITTYETTHPHLGKILISAGVRIFGMNPFGWRFTSALLGTLLIIVFYAFIKIISENSFISMAGTSLIICDCMHFALSRISTIDICIEFFILLMYFFMYGYIKHEKTDYKKAMIFLALSGLSMGMGVATKFTGIYAGAGLGIIFMIHTIKNTPKEKWLKLCLFCCCFFIAIPFIIYTLAFIPVVESYPSNNLFEKMINGTAAMIDYHSNLVATHPYSSNWYSWLINNKPLLTAYNDIANNKTSAIVIMGNPVITFSILPCLLFMIYMIIKKKDKVSMYLTGAYLFQIIPWVLVSRIVFIYHYFPSSVFGMLIVGYVFKLINEKYKNAKIYISIYLGIVLISFIYFYPVISGFPMSPEYVQRISWVWEN